MTVDKNIRRIRRERGLIQKQVGDMVNAGTMEQWLKRKIGR